MSPALCSALAAGAVAVTPNRRLARSLHREFAAAQRAAGRLAWSTPTILPYGAWLESLWLDVLAAGVRSDAPGLVSPVQATYLWHRIVAEDTSHVAPLIDSEGAIALATEAWSLLHAWGAGGPSWRGWAGADLSDDQAAFVRWAETYAAQLERHAAGDQAQLAEMLARFAKDTPAWRGHRMVWVGFIELTPQQRRLLAALNGVGAEVTCLDSLPAAPGRIQRAHGRNPRDELVRAFAWARAQLEAAPGSIIGVAIEGLAERRSLAQTLAEEILCPELQWPGHEDATRPYNLSLGRALCEFPIVSAALDLIALAHAPLSVGRAAALLRSPYLIVASSAWSRRARVERLWLEQGRRDISLGDAIGALLECDPTLAQRWQSARDAQRLPLSASPRVWAETWRAWLATMGWPGDRASSSAEYQARGVWDELLSHFAALGAVESSLTRPDALAALRALAANRIFQPEMTEASIHILGVLEAAGITFDGLWVAGLAAESWPPAPRPNPFLPLAWQRERSVPRSSAARELDYAEALTDQLLRAAPNIVVSHAKSADDHLRAASALIMALPELPTDATPAPMPSTQVMFAAAPMREAVSDDLAPPLPPGSRAPGGASLLEKQSDCPFRAVAVHRLKTEPWPKPFDGLSPIERGRLVHGALAAFWREVRDHATLAAFAPDALAAHIAAAVKRAMASGEIPAARWRKLPPVLAAGEADRIAGIVRRWLEDFDRGRPPFVVRHIELPAKLELGNLIFTLKLDRVDALPDGGVAIIDYKTGKAVAPLHWFDARPQATQLPLYAFAQRAMVPSDSVRAVAYAQLKPGDFRIEGLAADTGAWPGLPRPSDLKGIALADWTAVEARWGDALGALAGEIAAGHAPVAPRNIRTTCQYCGLQPLCRIGARSAEGPSSE